MYLQMRTTTSHLLLPNKVLHIIITNSLDEFLSISKVENIIDMIMMYKHSNVSSSQHFTHDL